MKTNTFLLFALLVLSAVSVAQPYGHTNYPNNSALSSGIRTSINSNGFLMAGVQYDPDNQGNIHIDKTNTGGAFSNPATSFQNKYHISPVAGAGCVLPTGHVNFCAGISVIETTPSNNEVYALAGAYQGGCFFATLDALGDTVNSILYPFPSVTFTFNIGKPLITESQNTPNTYFICGRFDSLMYVLNVDQQGLIQWSSYYHSNDPQAILECPYTGDVVIVGWAITPMSYGTMEDGFFMKLDAANGNVNLYKTYDGGISCDQFFSVAPAFSFFGGAQGFVIGGETDPAGLGKAWMLKVDVNGNIIWNTQLMPSTDNLAGRVTGVIERQNQSGMYEYYGLCNMITTGVNGLLVLKLSANGVPFSVSNSVADEFYYNSSTPMWGNSISYKNAAGGPFDTGLHLYANDNGDHFLLESYFNGISGCNETHVTIQAYGPGPSVVLTPWINMFSSMTICQSFLLSPYTMSFIPNQICSNNSIPGGSNARFLLASSGKTDERSLINLYPNPCSEKLTLEGCNQADLKVYNMLGELVHSEYISEEKQEIDLRHISHGTYIIKINGNGLEKTTSLIRN
jgi:hypothetical protein